MSTLEKTTTTDQSTKIVKCPENNSITPYSENNSIIPPQKWPTLKNITSIVGALIFTLGTGDLINRFNHQQEFMPEDVVKELRVIQEKAGEKNGQFTQAINTIHSTNDIKVFRDAVVHYTPTPKNSQEVRNEISSQLRSALTSDPVKLQLLKIQLKRLEEKGKSNDVIKSEIKKASVENTLNNTVDAAAILFGGGLTLTGFRRKKAGGGSGSKSVNREKLMQSDLDHNPWVDGEIIDDNPIQTLIEKMGKKILPPSSQVEDTGDKDDWVDGEIIDDSDNQKLRVLSGVNQRLLKPSSQIEVEADQGGKSISKPKEERMARVKIIGSEQSSNEPFNYKGMMRKIIQEHENKIRDYLTKPNFQKNPNLIFFSLLSIALLSNINDDNVIHIWNTLDKIIPNIFRVNKNCTIEEMIPIILQNVENVDQSILNKSINKSKKALNKLINYTKSTQN